MSDNIDVNLNFNTSTAQRNLDNFNNKLSNLQKTFNTLRGVIAGVAFGGFVNNLLKSADAMDDVADSTGLALSTVLGFSEAVRQNGGDTQDAVAAMQKFVLTLDEARNGSAQAQQAFNKLGIATEELGQNSNELFLRTVKGFKNITSETEEARLKTELFSKSMRGTAMAGVAGSISRTILEQREYVQATKDAAQANKEINKLITALSANLLPLAKNLGDVAKSLNANKKAIKEFIEVGLEIAKIAALFYGIGIAVRLVAGGFALFSGGIAGIIAAIRGIGKTFSAFINQLKGLAKAGEVTSETMAGLAKRWKYLQRDLPILANGIAIVTTALYGAYVAAKKFFGLGEDFSKPLKIEGEGAAAAPEGYDNLLDYFKKRREEAEKVQKANAELAISIRQTTSSYMDENDALLRNIDLAKEQFSLSTDELELQNALIDNSERLRKQLEDLYKQREKLAEDPTKASLIPVIDEEMNKVRESAVVTADAISQKIKELQALRQAQEDVTRSIEDTAKAFTQSESLQDLQDQLSLIGLYGEELEKQTVILQAQKALREEMQRLSIELLNLDAQRVQLGEEAYQRERARVIQQMMDVKSLSEAKIAAYEEEVAKKQKIDESYAEGASRALKDIADQYKPINMAQEAVRKGWGAIENAVDTFVDTGKFKFSDFARSVIADLAKMIAKAMIFKAISAALGAFGLKLPGMATGGPVEAGKGYIVGEKGPELFVPPGSGKIVSNKDLQGNGKGTGAVSAPVTNNYNTYNISALDAKSVAQMFAENRKAIFGANKMAEREMSYVGVR
jgi:lambda family phage tail tape measure protein